MKHLIVGLLIAALTGSAVMAQEPSLPTGLGSPSLPSGLGSAPAEQENETSLEPIVQFSGFVDVRAGGRLYSADGFDDASLGEARAQVSLDWSGENATIKLTSDFLFDGVLDEHDIDLNRGEGWIDLREASVLVRPTNFMDVKLGRQVLTWGTGDLLFINDLFPKDWNAFFIGRDVEYLKAPSDAIKVSLFGKKISADLVYVPEFDGDRYLDGRRLTLFDPLAGALTRVPQALEVAEEDGAEFAARLYGQVSSYEWALYGYHGFWKSPVGFDPLAMENTFPRLDVFGASLRGPLAGGIVHGEVGYYDSRDDASGSDPFVPNSQWRVLVGFERELIPNLTGAAQVYLEQVDDSDNRQVVTLRLTQQLMNQNLTLSAFNFYSPTDEDGYLRLNGNYKINDAWAAEIGGNLFYGNEATSFFGQFEHNSNVFVALRTSF